MGSPMDGKEWTVGPNPWNSFEKPYWKVLLSFGTDLLVFLNLTIFPRVPSLCSRLSLKRQRKATLESLEVAILLLLLPSGIWKIRSPLYPREAAHRLNCWRARCCQVLLH